MKRLLGLLMAVMVMMGGMAGAQASTDNVSMQLIRMNPLAFRKEPVELYSVSLIRLGLLRRFPMVDCLLNHLWRTQKRRHTTTLSCLLKKAVCFAHQQVDLRTWQNRQPIGKPF